MKYGYLRVSSDEQDVNSQKQGVVAFAHDKGWEIDEYITDEGVSGGKDPSKRNLGPLLKKLQAGDIVIAAEISRLGRDLYMVMDILHHCMKVGCIIYTVKDRFVLGDDIQSKVLAFAFGLAAEIERQMIRQRTAEGLRLRMKMGVLLGHPFGPNTPHLDKDTTARLVEQYNWGVPQRRIAENFKIDRSTVTRILGREGVLKTKQLQNDIRKLKQDRESRKALTQSLYFGEEIDHPELPRDLVIKLIEQDFTIPQIAQNFPQFKYEQIYDTIMCDEEFNTLYRKHGQKILVKSR